MSVTFDGTSNCGLTSRIGAQSIYPIDQLGVDALNGIAQLGGPAPSVATFAATNWSLPNITLVANEFALMQYGQTVSSFSSPTPGAPTFVQTSQFNTAGSPIQALLPVFTGANTQGNRIVVLIEWTIGSPVAFLDQGVTDTAGNVYDQVGATQNPGAGTLYSAVFECRSCNAALANTNAVAVQWATNVTTPIVQAFEYSGTNPFASSYGITTATATSTGPAQVALTATTAGDLLLAIGPFQVTGTTGVVTGNTQRGTIQTNIGLSYTGAELAAPDTSAHNVGFVGFASGTWFATGIVIPQAVSILPNAPPSSGDSFVVQPNQAQMGVTASGSWTIALAALVSGGTSPTGNANFNVQIWWSPDGVNFTWVGAATLGNINLATTSQQNTTATVSLGPRYFAGGSFYCQLALEVQTGAVPTGCTVALVQDGTNTKVTTPAFSWAPPTSNHTFCCFFFTGSLATSAALGAIWVMSSVFALYISNGSPAAFELFLGTAQNNVSVTSGAVLTTNSWYFVACTISGYPGALTATMYFKRVGMACCTVLSTTGSAFLVVPPSEMDFGSTGLASTLNLAGTIAAARVWNGQLTQAEIEAESQVLEPVRKADLFEFWPFDSDVDYVGRIKSIPMGVNGNASSQTPHSPPPIARRRLKRTLQGRA